MAAAGQISSFVERISRLLERVQYRRAETLEDKQEIFRMRHTAYVRQGAVPPHPSGMFTDAHDRSSNVWLMRVLIDGELAGSIRIHVAASLDHDLPARIAFADIVDPYLQSGHCLLDASRHVNMPEFSRRFPEMPLITMRPGFLAEQYFGVDYLLGASRADNQGAHRRLFGVSPWTGPREYPGVGGSWVLMAYDCIAMREKTHARYPFYRTDFEEQRELFERSSNSTRDSLRMLGREIAEVPKDS